MICRNGSMSILLWLQAAAWQPSAWPAAACGVEAGATVAAAQDCYGATYSLVAQLWPRYGDRGVFVDATDLDAVERTLVEERPVALIVETISNPLLKVVDIPRLAALCHAHDALLLVDNTFATPFSFVPLRTVSML